MVVVVLVVVVVMAVVVVVGEDDGTNDGTVERWIDGNDPLETMLRTHKTRRISTPKRIPDATNE